MDGPCTACHDPHGSRQKRLLSKESTDLCLGCHTALAASLAKAGARVHQPARDCLACHLGHGSNEVRLLRQGPPALCAECHDLGDAGLVMKHGGFAIDAARCLGCHEPHVSTGPGLLHAERHQPFTDGACEACHFTTAPPPREPELKWSEAKGNGLERCADCHDFGALPKAPGATGR
jgi:predicted CXXCH cytochrome family protein